MKATIVSLEEYRNQRRQRLVEALCQNPDILKELLEVSEDFIRRLLEEEGYTPEEDEK